MSCAVLCRKRSVVLTQLVQAVVMAVLIGSVFLHIGTSQASVVRRQPVLFFCVINQGVFAALVSTPGRMCGVSGTLPADCISAGQLIMGPAPLSLVLPLLSRHPRWSSTHSPQSACWCCESEQPGRIMPLLISWPRLLQTRRYNCPSPSSSVP